MELEVLRDRRTNKPIMQVNNARITFRNFAGRGDKYNKQGDRNFALVIPNHEIADKFVAEGFNVKVKPPRDEDDTDFIYLPVKVKFNGRGPNLWLQTNKATLLTEDTVGVVDNIDIDYVDMDIVPYDWENDMGSGRSAYLKGGCVYQTADRFTMMNEEC